MLRLRQGTRGGREREPCVFCAGIAERVPSAGHKGKPVIGLIVRINNKKSNRLSQATLLID